MYEWEIKRDALIEFVKDLDAILGPSLVGVIDIIRRETSLDQQTRLFQLLTQYFTPEEQKQLIESIRAKLEENLSLSDLAMPEMMNKEERKRFFPCPNCGTVSTYPDGEEIVECYGCGETFRLNFCCRECGWGVVYNIEAKSFKCPTCGEKYINKEQHSVNLPIVITDAVNSRLG